MKLSRFVISFAILSVFPTASLADWKPAPTPLMTRWGKQVTPENAWKEYPRPQLARPDWLCLNGLWDFALVDKGAAQPRPEGQILVPFPIESALSGVGKRVSHNQQLWYFRQFEVPANWKGKRVLLHFDAVDWEATVFVNGKEIGVHRGGFDPFTFDVTEQLQDGKNDLAVRVWDPTDMGAQPRGKQTSKPGGIWYTPVTGIWQTVWLEPVNETHIEAVQVTTDIEKGTGELAAAVSGRKNARIVVTFQDGTKFTSEQDGQPVRFSVKNPQLWTPDAPKLYEIDVGVLKPGSMTEFEDRVSSYFAFRKISTGKDVNGLMRLMLNNKPVFQIGPLDQGWWPDGLLTPPSDAAMKYDLEVLKKLGMNMLRKHIKVEPARYYHYCDAMGLLVWQDMPSAMGDGRKHFVQATARDDAEFTPEEKAQFRRELKAMIDNCRFFPSIVVWVPFNEGWGQSDTNDVLKWVKQYDPTRLVNGPSGWTDRGFGDMKDMHNYPGPGMFPVMPDRVSVLGEFGGLGLVLEGHLWKERNNWGYQTFKTTEDLRDGYHQLMLRLHPLIFRGLSAAVYTQTTDVEVEVNGLMTYDREVIKLDVAAAARWHQALHGPLPEYRVVIPTSEKSPQRWRYTIAKPMEGWQNPDFDDAKWQEGPGGFGTNGTPGAIVRTEWKTDDIWLRRSFELKELPKLDALFRMHHDEDVEIYINGVLAAKLPGYATDYGEYPIRQEARKAMKLGSNTIAVHCHQTKGGQYIDVGLLELVETKK
jgi:hypothetical protein